MLPERFTRRIEPGDNGCWLWTGHVASDGYGKVSLDGRMWLAHRAVYTLLVGPIPPGLALDHQCRVRHCVNPGHLAPCTTRENTLAPGSLAISATHAAKTQCPAGHPYDQENTYVSPNGKRHCRTCHREHVRRSASR